MSSPVTMLIYPNHQLNINFIGDQPGYSHFGLLKQLALGRYKSRTGSTRTASPGRINSDRLGSTRIMKKKKKNITLKKTETFTHLKAKIPVNNGPN